MIRGATALAVLALAAPVTGEDRPFGPGERVVLKITYAHLLAGRAWVSVAADPDAPGALQFIAEAKSEGFFAWLFRFKVNDRTVARWDPAGGCSLGIEKHLREGKAVRDQVVTFEPRTGVAHVVDRKIKETRFELEPCTLDVLSAFFVTRLKGVPETEPLKLPVFDNGKKFLLAVRFLGRETLDLPPPFGKETKTVVVEPQLVEGTGLFVKKGRLKIWLTDDHRRVPVRMRSKVAVGSVSADLESFEAPEAQGKENTP